MYIILLILKVYFTKDYARLEKTWVKTPCSCQNWIVTIFWKRLFKQVVQGAEGWSEIIAILNKYKDTLDDLIDSSDTKSPDHLNSPNWAKFIYKRLCNAPKSRNGSPTFLKKDCLDKDISITSLETTPKIEDSQVYQRHNIAPLGIKSERA